MADFGSALSAARNRNRPSGTTLDEAPPAMVAALGRTACSQVVETRLPAATGRTLLLPLAENGRDIDMIMACVASGPWAHPG